MSRLPDSHLLRVLFLALGIVALLLGVLGIFLPLLPTTPFILLAAACFARGSARLHDWLLAHRVMGAIIHEWQEHRAMPPGIKPWAFLMMAVSFGFSIFMMESGWHRLMLATFAVVLAIFLWRVPVRASKP